MHNPAVTGWEGLFWEAFRQSRNAMLLLDGERLIQEINGAWLSLTGYSRRALIGRPIYELKASGNRASDQVWREAIARRQFTGVAVFRRADDSQIKVEFAGHPEIVTGRQLVLVVALYTPPGSRTPPFRPSGSTSPLTRRELQVVELVGLGLVGPEIASDLHVSHNTVRTHIRNAMTKTGSRSRAQLVAKSLAEGIGWQHDD